MNEEFDDLTDPLDQETKDILPIVLKNNMNAYYQPELFPDDRERNYQPSMTIPDQSMSIREIMDRYARGLPIVSAGVPIYEGEEGEFADLSKMDLADREKYIEERKAEYEELHAKIEADKLKRMEEHKAKLKAQLEKENKIEQWLKLQEEQAKNK